MMIMHSLTINAFYCTLNYKYYCWIIQTVAVIIIFVVTVVTADVTIAASKQTTLHSMDGEGKEQSMIVAAHMRVHQWVQVYD